MLEPDVGAPAASAAAAAEAAAAEAAAAATEASAGAWREGLNYVTVEVSGHESPPAGGVFRGVGVHRIQFDLVQ